jgi:hypothetical protein
MIMGFNPVLEQVPIRKMIQESVSQMVCAQKVMLAAAIGNHNVAMSLSHPIKANNLQHTQRELFRHFATANLTDAFRSLLKLPTDTRLRVGSTEFEYAVYLVVHK